MPFHIFSWLVSAEGAGNGRPTRSGSTAILGRQRFKVRIRWVQLSTIFSVARDFRAPID